VDQSISPLLSSAVWSFLVFVRSFVRSSFEAVVLVFVVEGMMVRSLTSADSRSVGVALVKKKALSVEEGGSTVSTTDTDGHKSGRKAFFFRSFFRSLAGGWKWKRWDGDEENGGRREGGLGRKEKRCFPF